ncbi:MAG: SAM-dependent methyltransferase [Kofleriaceae bacterium]
MATRTVHHGDGLAFLARGPLEPDHAIVTSLPDHSELPELGVDGWKRWFVDTAALCCRTVAPTGVAVFYQTDVKHDGRWIDKAHLVQLGADAAGSHLLWHKVVCRVPAGGVTYGRPAYAHVVCVSRERRVLPGAATADVLPALGAMSWSRAMGAAACEAIVRFLVAIGTTTVVDPFCGQGSILAAANALGLDAIGVELSRRRAAKARIATHVLV